MALTEQKEIVMKQRAEKDQMFSSSDQILSASERANFNGLKYFDYDPSYCINTKPIPLDKPEKVTLDFGAHGSIDLAKHSYVDFSIPSGKGRLYLFCRWEDQTPQEFGIPYKDKTNGSKTYGGGRNLDVTLHTDGSLTLDFNTTSNLFCAYNEEFVCAQPPPENWLDFPVPIGEMTFKESN